ncbi:hypothetical protein EDD16DRAFT_1714678 [Pisolithus croceorrhizus]|nr:hypothetical protein EDD16DRAFT_1714678 [Pisolithus croceorrhizus]
MGGAQLKHRPPFMKPFKSVPRPVLLPGADDPSPFWKIRHNLYGKTLRNGALHHWLMWGTPTTIASYVANRGIGEGAEEQWEQQRAFSLQSATATSTDGGVQDEQEEPQAVSAKGVCDL